MTDSTLCYIRSELWVRFLVPSIQKQVFSCYGITPIMKNNVQTLPSNLQVLYLVDPAFTPFICFSHQHPFFPASAQTVAPFIVESFSCLDSHSAIHARPVSVSLIFSSPLPLPSPGVKAGQVPDSNNDSSFTAGKELYTKRIR